MAFAMNLWRLAKRCFMLESGLTPPMDNTPSAPTGDPRLVGYDPASCLQCLITLIKNGTFSVDFLLFHLRNELGAAYQRELLLSSVRTIVTIADMSALRFLSDSGGAARVPEPGNTPRDRHLATDVAFAFRRYCDTLDQVLDDLERMETSIDDSISDSSQLIAIAAVPGRIYATPEMQIPDPYTVIRQRLITL